MDLKKTIRVIEGFPKEGISFKDVTTLLQDKDALKYTVDTIVSYLKDKNIDVIVGPEARGFLFGFALASKLNIPFILVRKAGKLPYKTISYEYDLEYGSAKVEMQVNEIQPGWNVLIHDDLLATGGTVASVAKLIEQVGGEVISLNFVIELTGLNGIDKLQGYDVMSLLKYEF